MRYPRLPILLLLAALFLPQAGYSHALNPDSIDRYAELTLTPSHLALVYELILGLNPTEKVSKRLDPDGDNQITDEERDAYLAAVSREYADQQVVELGGRRLPLQYKIGDAYSTLGHNGIYAIKIELGFLATLPADLPRNATLDFSYQDGLLTKIPGWKQIQVVSRDGVQQEGHIPYRDYKPFDWEILNTKGFAPSTDAVALQVTLPEVSDTLEPALSLPEKTVYLDPMVGVQIRGGVESGGSWKKYLSWLPTFLFFLVVIAVLGALYVSGRRLRS